MSDPTPAAAPGWYPESPGSSRVRWWDGARWTDQVHNQGAPQPPLRAPEGTSPDTVFAWILAVLPLATILTILPIDFGGYLRAAMLDARSPYANGTAALRLAASPGYGLTLLLGLCILALTVVLAYFDWRELGRRGVPRRFHWAFAFLQTGMVYMIGRAVVVRRRTGRGLAVLWVWIAAYVIAVIVVFSILLSTIAPVIGQLAPLHRY
ncbi:DUF2510 domain-containing protein [Galbitalea soli]|uniref:DUF2510 domain-containing protein n=1 Tax=Galbitalea soli TaxID=1268042 RepID=A0A7C9TNJ6_9MICO|nr:DUF2510 domain-containing protein [Galbitalea soli]NEM89761.1 DUF2510 domain-containing protein [Galbitalea soli]NYJ30463.1 hypothetical protein [Galbitalea soli]